MTHAKDRGELPLAAAVAFTHAAVEVIAADASVDLLHIKGPAIDSSLGMTPDAGGGLVASPRRSIDTDVWVRPEHADRLTAALKGYGWVVFAPFRWGASFEHAATFTRDGFVSVDVHRTFPGISAGFGETFETLWCGRQQTRIGGITCQVPSVTAQLLILLLHTARNGPGGRDAGAWETADKPQREAVWALARHLGAEVPLAAAVGELDHFVEHREHDMWYYLSTGTGTWAQQWWARLRAERNPLKALGRGFRMAFPTRRGMEHRAGGHLGPAGLARAYSRRVIRAFRPRGVRVRRRA